MPQPSCAETPSAQNKHCASTAKIANRRSCETSIASIVFRNVLSVMQLGAVLSSCLRDFMMRSPQASLLLRFPWINAAFPFSHVAPRRRWAVISNLIPCEGMCVVNLHDGDAEDVFEEPRCGQTLPTVARRIPARYLCKHHILRRRIKIDKLFQRLTFLSRVSSTGA